MILLTEELRERLLANGRERNADHVPVVKLFNPLGEGIWLATERMPTATPCSVSPISAIRAGRFSLLEMTSIRLPFGMGIERDILFATDLPISSGQGPPAGPEAFATRNACSTTPPSLAETAREISAWNPQMPQMRKVVSATLSPSGSSACGAVLRVRGLRPSFLTGLEVERVSAARRGDSPHGYAQAEDHPQRFA
jgi:hypothetical protein